MPHRSDLEAAHARIGALERELAAARGPEDRRAAFPPRVPYGFEVREEWDRLRITWSPGGEPWPPAARAFLAVMVPAALLLGIRHDQLLGVCFAGIVAGLTVLILMGDRIAVEVEGERLHIPRSAVTGRGARRLWRAEILQLYCVLRQAPERVSWELWCHLVTGERVCLVRAIDSADGAEFLRRALAHRLDIARPAIQVDVPVRRAGR